MIFLSNFVEAGRLLIYAWGRIILNSMPDLLPILPYDGDRVENRARFTLMGDIRDDLRCSICIPTTY